jgi:uncharacterized integral membrane protein
MNPAINYLYSALSIGLFILCLKANTRWHEYIIGYKFQQGYSTPTKDCIVERNNDVQPCASIYRLPWVLNSNETCTWSLFVCKPTFLKESHALILIGLTQDDNFGWGDPSKNPSEERNHTSWKQNQYDEVYRNISSNDTCNGMDPRNTTECIGKFIKQPVTVLDAYCFGSLCLWNEVPWFASIWICIILLLFAILILPNCAAIRVVFWLEVQLENIANRCCPCCFSRTDVVSPYGPLP